MTDRDKLREALALVGFWVNTDRVELGPSDWEALALVITAAASTLPRTKMVEVWRVEFAGAAMGLPYIEQDRTREEAEQQARKRRSEGATCVKVTGPHMQEVPDGR